MIRCPSCGTGQLATRATCSKCQGSLTEIVAGYKDRLALALDREQLEADGWRLIDVKEDVDGTPLSVRYRRTAQAQPREVRQRRRDENQSSDSRGGSWYWVLAGILVAVLAVAATVAFKLHQAKSDEAEATPTDRVATLGIDGAPGLLFTGSISDGTATRQINGGVPQSFDLEAYAAYSVVVQKQGSDLALLRLTLTCANGTTFTSSTTSPSGVLALSAHCEPDKAH